MSFTKECECESFSTALSQRIFDFLFIRKVSLKVLTDLN